MAQVGCWALVQFNRLNPERIALVPAAVRAGEIWRMVTFCFCRPASAAGVGRGLLAFAWYLFF